MDTPRLETIARNLVKLAESLAGPTKQLREAAEAIEEAAIKAAILQIEEDEKVDPMAELLRAMREIQEQLLMEELAVDPADLEVPRKMPRPPKRLGPVNKANYTASRPPRRARSSCYIRRH